MPVRKLNESEIESELRNLNKNLSVKWDYPNGKLEKEFRFPDFITAFGFMTKAAILAEKMDHHPEWSNVYGVVKVQLYTHSIKGISNLDFTLAKEMEKLV